MIKKRKFMALLCILFAVMLLTVGTLYAYFQIERSKNAEITYGTGKVTAEIYFKNGDVVTPSDAYTSNDYTTVELFDENAVNYIRNLSVKVKYAGAGEYCIRTAVAEEWKEKDVIRRMPPLDFNLNAGLWIDTRMQDSFLYYYNQAGATYRVDSPQEITLFEGYDTTEHNVSYPQGTTLRVKIAVQGVQWNRVEALWGITALPSPKPTTSPVS